MSSGDPYIRGESTTLLIMGSTLIFVLSIFSIIYLHFVKEPKYESWIPISRLNVLRKSVAFARFENRHTDEDNDTVDVGLRYEAEEQLDDKSASGFNNPMYEREQEVVTLGNVETEMLQPETSNKADEFGSSLNDINLVDINLGSIVDKNE